MTMPNAVNGNAAPRRRWHPASVTASRGGAVSSAGAAAAAAGSGALTSPPPVRESLLPSLGLLPFRSFLASSFRSDLLFSFLLFGLVESESSPASLVVSAAQRGETSLPVSDAAQLGLGVSVPDRRDEAAAARIRLRFIRLRPRPPAGRGGPDGLDPEQRHRRERGRGHQPLAPDHQQRERQDPANHEELRPDAKARAFAAGRCRHRRVLRHRKLPPLLGRRLRGGDHRWRGGAGARWRLLGFLRRPWFLTTRSAREVGKPVWTGSGPARAGGRREARRRRRRPPAEGRFSGLVVGIAGGGRRRRA
ncbi:hypothetical protein C2845_PM05G00870 [Panicum miliaceum]|uniref:Uncharacterized protein n=1 Tax=Panicum miliaceum TaxID=4540 RepID=A0A3L6SXW0_PANMI|nr:hypothetical protein C2845_PM05G00870 [Panicum miliaceum]